MDAPLAGCKRALAIINVRLTRFWEGNLGDYRVVGEGVFEARIHYGPGYRMYFMLDGADVVLLLCGGDKGSQQQDIWRAQELARARREL